MPIFTNGGAPSQEALDVFLNALAPVETKGDTYKLMAIQPRGDWGFHNSLLGAWHLIHAEVLNSATPKEIQDAQFALLHKALTGCTARELAEALTEAPVEGSWDWWCAIYDSYLGERVQGRGKTLEDTRRHIMAWASSMERSSLLEHLTPISGKSI